MDMISLRAGSGRWMEFQGEEFMAAAHLYALRIVRSYTPSDPRAMGNSNS